MSHSFRLPVTTIEHPPAFSNARGCREWLSQQPIANPQQLQTNLLTQLSLMNRYALPPSERLKMLEHLREALYHAQHETSRRFVGRPLPLALPEKTALDTNLALWDALRIGYLHCLVAAQQGDSALLVHAAPISQRALAAMAMQMVDLLRAGHVTPIGYWRNLHAIYEMADNFKVVEEAVVDPLQFEQRQTTVSATYLQPILMQACSPYSLPTSRLNLVAKWIQRWSGKAQLTRLPPEDTRLRPVAIDLDQDVPGCFMPDHSARIRWLDLTEFAHGLRKRILLLQRGDTPEQLKLGTDCTSAQCEQLLMHVYRHCCKGGFARLHPRRNAERTVRIVLGMESVLKLMAGESPNNATRNAEHVEEWRVLDENPGGMRLTRLQLESGSRVNTGQLLAVCPRGGSDFLLAIARWAMVNQEGDLLLGLQMLPGRPQPITLRRTGVPDTMNGFRQALMLPAVPALDRPPSLVLPVAWFHPSRVFETEGDETEQYRTTKLVERGNDFDLADYESS